jgi:acetylornithine/succinyldiaminopimelate/putrescine aminotransferase
MAPLQLLKEIRDFAGATLTQGLSDEQIASFVDVDPSLAGAIEQAHAQHGALRDEFSELLAGDEATCVHTLQSDYVNFYDAKTINPYVALAAAGPWLVTSHGAVLHDNGGYGMLGLGHAPEAILDAMSAPWVMANIMTPSFSHKRLSTRLKAEVGQTRAGDCPYSRFICMNSGSESVTVAMRIADILAMNEAGPRPVKYIALRGAFHGRTDRPAQLSHSTLPKYQQYLHSFQGRDNLYLVEPNNIDSLKSAFAAAEADGAFVAGMFFEPVMGEGNPGELTTRAFFDAARRLCTAHGTLLVADSIQAGLRGTGYLSIVDYPGFEDADAPDMETYSKALNAGQYPMSVLALGPRAAELYQRGVYGNTMTTNPRALEVACAVLDDLTPETRENIRARGNELVDKLTALMDDVSGLVLGVRGTGLLLAVELDPERAAVIGYDGVETWCRRHGLGVIHGGRNAIRFTPHFNVTSAEVDLIVSLVREALQAVLEKEALASGVEVQAAAEARA